MELERIFYLSEPVPDYHKLLDGCVSLKELTAFLTDWRLVAHDAWLVACAMTKKDWPVYQKGLRSERRGKYAGDAWSQKYAAILLPSILFHVSLTATRFGCPWGLAYWRHRDAGHIVEENGIAIWKGQPQSKYLGRAAGGGYERSNVS